MMQTYLKIFGATVAFMLGLTACLSLIFETFEPITGDLTRIGNYAEKDFGWHAAQPIIQISGNGADMHNPDILVLGDSFSRGNIWQSVVASKLPITLQSFEFGQIGCIDNWIQYALDQTSAKTIIIESVERVLVSRFQSLNTCKVQKPTPFSVSPSSTSATLAGWTSPEWHIFRTLKIAYNAVEMARAPDRALRGNVINAPIDTQCAKFSNRRSDRLLYFLQDEEKLEWSDSSQSKAIANIVGLQKLFQENGKKLVVMVVPDKLSTYQQCLLHDAKIDVQKTPDIIAALIAAGVSTPDMLVTFRKNAGTINDLFQPNDTHLSTTGYILMGEKLAQFLSEK